MFEIPNATITQINNIINVETLEIELYDKIDKLLDIYPLMGYKNLNKVHAISALPGYLAYHNIICYKLNEILYVKKEDVKLFCTFVKNFNEFNYYRREEAQKKLGLSPHFFQSRDRKTLTPYKFANKIYYSKNEIDNFVNLKNETKTVTELRTILGYQNASSILKAATDLKLNGNTNVDIISPEMHIFGENILIKGYEDVLKYLQYRRDLKSIDSYYDKLLYKTNHIKVCGSKASITLDDFKLYAKERYERLKEGSSNLIMSHNSHVRLYSFLYEKLKKPMHQYNDKEFKKLCAELKLMRGFINFDEKVLGLFAQYLKNKYRNCKLPNTKIKQIKCTKKENAYCDYTTEQWISLAHIIYEATSKQEKIKLIAAKPKVLSNTWTYIALHFVASWRKNDIRKIPFPDLTLLGFKNGKEFLEYIINDGIFTENMGEIIYLDILNKIQGYGDKASKNKQPLKFVISKSWLRPIGLLLAICEGHRQTPVYSTEKTNQLISADCCKFSNCYKLFGKEYVTIMGERNFSNLAATRIMTKLYEKKGLEKNIALSQLLPAAARGHAPYYRSCMSPTTADFYLTYAYNNKDNDINNVTFAMAEREFMSFTAYQLLFTLNTGFKYEKLNEQTDKIKKLSLTPMQIHSMSMSIMKRQSEINKLIKNLISQPKHKIKEILIAILDGKAPSKHNYANCLLRAMMYVDKKIGPFDVSTTDICVMKQSPTCFGCDYLIGEKLFLLEITLKIKSSLRNFERAEYERDKKRYRGLLQSIYNIVLEAITILGQDKVSTYITEDISTAFALAVNKSINLKE